MSRRKKIIWTSVSISLGLGSLCLIERVTAMPSINCGPQSTSYVTKGILKTDSPTSSSNPGSPKKCTFDLNAEYVEVPECKKNGRRKESSSKRKRRHEKSEGAQSKKVVAVVHESKIPVRNPRTLKPLEKVKNEEKTAENPLQFLHPDYSYPVYPVQLSLLKFMRRQPCENFKKILEGLEHPLHVKRVKKSGERVEQKLNSRTSDDASKKTLPPPTVRRSDEKAVRIK